MNDTFEQHSNKIIYLEKSVKILEKELEERKNDLCSVKFIIAILVLTVMLQGFVICK